MKKTISNLFAKSMLLLSAFSVSTASLQAQSSDCCFTQPCQPCCDTPSWLAIGGSLLGAAAGAAAGAGVASSKHGKHGKKGLPGEKGINGRTGRNGPQGQQGPDGDQGPTFQYPGNKEDTLSIFYNIYFDDPGFITILHQVPYTVIITPFATLPDQTTIEGTPFAMVFNNETIRRLAVPTVPDITIPSPLYGNYSIGFRVINPQPSTVVDFALLEFEFIPQIYRSQVQTGFTTLKIQDTQNNFINELINLNQAQISGNFTYDPNLTNPIPSN